MLEPDVTITDYILSGQCFLFALLIYRKSATMPWLFLFGTLSVASLTGGTVHGFFPNESAFGYALLWRTTLIAIGAMALAAWYVGVAFLRNKPFTEWIKKAAIAQFLLFTVIILFYSQRFLVAALNYLPALIFLLIIFTRGYFKTKERALLSGVTSIVLTCVGSFVQIAKISLHSQYFTHNALYHAIQFVALCLLFSTARWDITKRRQDGKYHQA